MSTDEKTCECSNPSECTDCACHAAEVADGEAQDTKGTIHQKPTMAQVLMFQRVMGMTQAKLFEHYSPAGREHKRAKRKMSRASRKRNRG